MKLIKSIIKKLGDNYIDFFKNYLITNIAIIISTILTIIFLNDSITFELFKYEIFFVINSFTIENFFKDKKPRIIGYIIAYIISFVLGYLFNVYEAKFANFFIFYMISIISINLFFIIKKIKLDLSTYLHQIFSNLVTTTIINLALNIGVFSVLGIISSLLLSNYDGDLFLRTFIAVFGFYTIPAYIYAFINKEAKISELANVLLKYVIIPLNIIAILVIYIYVFKIIITHNMPSNSVFAISFALFIVTIPTFVLAKDFDFKNKFLNFFNKNISFIFIPIYIIQSYAIIIRVFIYGLTEERYLGLIIILIELIILFLMKFKERKYLSHILIVFSVISAITFIVPGINYEDASTAFQVKRIEKILKNKEFSELNGEEKAKVVGSYRYLKSKEALDKLTVKIDESKIDFEDYYNYYDYFYENYDNSEEKIDISNYVEMQRFISKESYINEGIIKVNDYQVDLNETINLLIEKKEIKEKLIFSLDENHDFYVIRLNISGQNKKANYYDLEGYILTK